MCEKRYTWSRLGISTSTVLDEYGGLVIHGARMPRTPVSVRTRFEIFKRDSFTCRYCGRTSPEVVLEVDHIVPVADGGDNDEMNLVTSCWDCNRGKSSIPLTDAITGEDPHDKAIEIAERERQLQEYNYRKEQVRLRIEGEVAFLNTWWKEHAKTWLNGFDKGWLRHELRTTPYEDILEAMEIAVFRGRCSNLCYAAAVIKNKRAEGGL